MRCVGVQIRQLASVDQVAACCSLQQADFRIGRRIEQVWQIAEGSPIQVGTGKLALGQDGYFACGNRLQIKELNSVIQYGRLQAVAHCALWYECLEVGQHMELVA